ncbi:MAG: ATP-grasp domain-containing protein [Pseudomonadota bacterium]
MIEDKLSEKQFFANAGTKVADFFEVTCADDLVDEPGFIKLAKGGYDGKGTYFVANKDEAVAIYEMIKSAGVVLFEHQLDYAKELSVIAASNSRELILYPLVETHQEDNTCRYVSYPAGVSDEIENRAREDVAAIMQQLDTRGLFAFELFLTNDGELILNESAPRPHNSGHITMDIFEGDQFENHMRAVAGLDFVQPQPRHQTGLMLNLLGTRDGPAQEAKVRSTAGETQQTVHLYGKQESRVKRKMGHINLWGDNQWQRARQLAKTLEV